MAEGRVVPDPAAVDPAPEATLLALTFEAGGHTFAVPAALVGVILGSGRALPEGTSVVDVVGLLGADAEEPARGCFILLQEPGSTAPPIAVTATRAHEVSHLRTSDILPLPAYLFEGESPFLGVLTVQEGEGGRAPGAAPAVTTPARAVFLLAGPDRLSRSAASA